MEIDVIIDRLDAKRPLLICDIDEVVLHFVAPFEAYLGARGLRLRKTSLKLGGNVVDIGSGEALSAEATSALVSSFHREGIDRQPAVEGARATLAVLAQDLQIVFLTNIPEELKERRIRHLASLGLSFPLLRNDGSKAGAAARLSQTVQAASVFIDDLPPHHESVKTACPSIVCIHYMADDEFRAFATPGPTIAEKAESWPDIHALCAKTLVRLR